MKRSPPPAVADRDIGAGVEQQGDHVGPIVVTGPVQRRPAVAADRVDGGVGRDELGKDQPVAANPGPVERGVAVRVGGADGFRGVLNKPVDGVVVAAFGGIDDIGDEVLGVAAGTRGKEQGTDREPQHGSIGGFHLSSTFVLRQRSEDVRPSAAVVRWTKGSFSVFSIRMGSQGEAHDHCVVDDHTPERPETAIARPRRRCVVSRPCPRRGSARRCPRP